MDELMTVDEVAGLLKMNQQTIRNYVDAGILPGVRIGKRRVRIRRAALEEFIAAGETGGLPEPMTVEESEADAHEAPPPTGLPANGRKQLAAALAESDRALRSDDREQLARAFSALADAARELAAALEGTAE